MFVPKAYLKGYKLNMDILILVISLVLLFLGGEIFVKGSSRLAYRLGISPMIVGLTIVAFGTSTPELGVSIKASLIGNNNIAIGNVVGSNIFNFLFILGLCSIISPLKVRYEFIKFDVPVMIFASLLLGILSFNNQISALDGVILFSCAILYLVILIKTNKAEESQTEIKQESYLRIGIFMTIGLGLLIFGSSLLVDSAISISKDFGVSDKIIGLTIVAAGTSLPELITSIIATIRGEKEIAIGNVIGSNILNIFIILGLSAPFSKTGLLVESSILHLDIPLMIFTAIIAWPLMRTGYQLDRKEGSLLVGVYVCYIGYLIKFS